MKWFAIIAALSVCPHPAKPAVAESSNLVALVQAALADSPDVRAAENRWKAAKAAAARAAALDDPMVGADFERTDSTTLSDYSDIEFMVQQDIPWFGKRRLVRGAANGDAIMAEMDYRMKTLETASMVKQAYYDLWQARQELRVNQESQGLLSQSINAAMAKYEAGRASQADVLKAQIELTRVVESRADFERTERAALAELKQLAGREPEPPAADEELAPHFDLGHDMMETMALDQRPELVGLRKGGIAAAESELNLAKKSYAPDFQVRVEARHFEGNGGIQEYDTGLFFNFPWFNRSRNSSAIVEAKLKLEATRDSYEMMRRRTMADVTKLHDGVHAMQHHYELYRDTIIPQQRAAVEAARAGYESDQLDFLDLLDAERMLLDFEMQNLHHAAEAYRLAAQLEALVGGELPEVNP